MTALEACEKIEEAIKSLHEGTLNSDWEWCHTVSQTDEEHLFDQMETLQKTRSYFDIQGSTSMWFVSTKETNATLALCGNSPTAEARSRYISWVNPQNIKLLIDRIRELEEQCKQ